MNGVLERRCRRLLRVLPESYRAARGEELLGVLLDTAGEGRRWPAVGEAVSLVLLGLRVRAGVEVEAGAAGERAEATRNVALLSVFLLALSGVAAAAQAVAWRSRGGFVAEAARGWWSELHAYVPAAWLLVYLALIAGLRRTGRVLAVALCLFTATGATQFGVVFDVIPAVIGTVAVLLSFRHGAARVRHRLRWLAALVPMALLIAWMDSYVSMNAVERFLRPFLGVEVVGAVLLAAAGLVCVQAWRSPVWPLAAAVSLSGFLAPPLLWMLSTPFTSPSNFIEALAAMDVGFVLLAGLSVARRRVVRRLRTA